MHFTGVGTCLVDASQSGNGSFEAAPGKQQSITITQGTSVITVTSSPPNTQAGTGYQPAAKSNSGNAVTIALDAHSTGCIIYVKVVWFKSIGTCVVDFSDPGNSNYTASSIKKSFVITKGNVTVRASASPSSASPGTQITLTATLSSSFPTGSVTFKIHTTTLCIATVSGGKATCKESKRFAKGSYSVAANYSGSSSFYAKTGTTTLKVT